MFASNTTNVNEQPDPQFNYVTMLLHGDGTNGAQNNTFTDSSNNGFTITRNGNTTQGTFSPYGDNWSNYFDGTGDYLTAPDNAAWDVGSSNWTAEAWVFPTASPNQPIIIGQWTSSYAWAMQLTDDSSRNLRGLVYTGSYTDFSGSTPLTLNAWNHCVFTRDGTTLRLYLNGVQVATNSFGSGSINTSSSVLSIGADGAGSQPFQGYLSNVRFVNGTCLYPNGTTFTPPTSPLTAVTNTKLLTCQSNRFIDNSTNAFTITRNGDVSVQRFSPFAPTAAYSAATIGGSGYFDGSGDYLTATASSLSGTFTVEGWVYRNTTSTTASVLEFFGIGDSNTTTGFQVYVGNAGASLYVLSNNAVQINGGDVVQKFGWTHVAVVRNSSNVVTLYVNGTAVGSTWTTSATFSANRYVGAGYYGGGIDGVWTGYISGYRVTTTAVYTANFTPPTTPPTDITNTQLLLNFTNAGIIDNAMMNDLETVGNAQISTSVKKYGTGSLAFDGSGDYLVRPDAEFLRLSSGDFTIEAWVYLTGNQPQFDGGVASYGATTTSAGWAVSITGSSAGGTLNRLVYGVNASASGGAPLYGVNGIALNTWTHIAVTKSGTTVRLFINGSLDNSGTVTATPTTSTSYFFYVGTQAYDPTATTRQFAGYIDDLRITKYARYTANFTPPAAAFPNN